MAIGVVCASVADRNTDTDSELLPGHERIDATLDVARQLPRHDLAEVLPSSHVGLESKG
jgi:hypothetical protein